MGHLKNKTKEELIKEIEVLKSDITKLKLTELALTKKTQFAKEIIDSSALSIWISDENGTAIQTNPACLEFCFWNR